LPIVLLEGRPGFPHRHHGFQNRQIRHADSNACTPLSVVTAVEASRTRLRPRCLVRVSGPAVDMNATADTRFADDGVVIDPIP
jgi:hypothetical protein